MERYICKNCAHWNIAETRHGSPSSEHLADGCGGWREPGDEGYLAPHANLDWAHCKKALEGWEPDTHKSAAAMAVFDGSSYMAELWTRHDHFCSEYSPRAPASPPSKGGE